MSKNEDVIELGSSDEEAKPTPKKRKLPNAMVAIPGQRPLKFVRSNSTIIQKAINPANTAPLLKNPITFRNINNNCNAPILKKTNSTPSPVSLIQNVKNNIKVPVAPQMLALNPLGYFKSLTKQITVKKMPLNKKPKSSNVLQGSKLLSNLPPGLTIKPVSQPGVSGTKREQNISKPKKPEVSSMEIDEEESFQSSTHSPHWYLRPEEQGYIQPSYEETDELIDNNTPFSMEEQNNMEPDALKYVEIVIEDSPVKHHNKTGKELAITIEDSPKKPITSNNKDIESNSEKCDKTPLSKKKLQYPKGKNVEKQVVEIEIDICESGFNCNDSKESSCQSLKAQESEKSEKINDDFSEKHTSDILTKTSNQSNEEQKKVCDEFHPEYQKFIDLCFELENSNDMKKIVEKKIKAYYKQCPKEYVESEDFIEMVSSKVISIKASPDKMYLYIKDIVDELNVQRKMSKAVVAKKNVDKESNEEDIDEDFVDYKRQRQIRILEKTVKKIHRAIQKLEVRDIDFEDDEDSVYLLTERYKERLVKVYEKLCQVTNTKMPSEPRIHLEARPGQPSGPARKLEAWINKKVPIGTPLPFPDYHDVVCCVREANKEDRLGWSEMEIMDEARDLFTRCGKKLQKRRQENEWRIASSRVSHHADPAENSADLRKKFEENKKIAASKENDLLNKFVEKQHQMKLEAVEIGDKEADESPIESEEDDDNTEESSSLDDRQKRTDTLKKIIEEKTKKNEEKKNNSQHIENIQNVDETKVTDAKNTESNAKSQHNESENVEANQDKEKQELGQEKEIDTDKDNMSDNEDGANVSFVDELNLLEKLHSDDEINSSQDSSDSDESFITLDTIELDSDAENSQTQPIDVISIENSSYSENESSMDCYDQDLNKNSTDRTDKEMVENILLASSDDEETSCAAENPVDCINLRDDNISITETTVDGETIEKRSIDSEDAIDIATEISESSVNNDDAIAKCDESSADSLTCLTDSGVTSEIHNALDASGSGTNDMKNVNSQINEENVKGGCTDHEITNEAILNNKNDVKENENDNQIATVSC